MAPVSRSPESSALHLDGAARATRRTLPPRSVGRSALGGVSALGSAGLLSLLLGGCASELADGTPNFDDSDVPRFQPGDGSQPGVNGDNPLDGSQGSDPLSGPDSQSGNEGNVNVTEVTNSQADRDRSITGTGDTGPLTDEFGNPLSVDQLPPLQDCRVPGPRLIRRLTAEQYRNTLVRAFGRDDLPDANALADTDTLGYNVDVDDNLIQGLDAQSLMNLGEDIATWAGENGVIGQIANGCTKNDNNCRQQFVRTLGERISREPLDQQRVDSFVGLWTEQITEDGVTTPLVNTFEEGAQLVITAMVQSPYLLYRRELGQQEGGEYRLTPFEVASELSYFLTNAPPDEELMQAARNNQLSTQEQIEAQAERLLNTDAATEVLAGLVESWLDVDGLPGKVKDPASGLDLSDELRQAMLDETAALFLDVFDRGGSIGELYSANYTFLNQNLANFYGVAGVTGNELQQVSLEGTNRAPGLLGHGAYLSEHALADNSSPVQRAFIVRERVLCNELPEVPSNLDTNLRPPEPTVPSRERYRQHSENAVCYNCHRLMDPIGFSFESYDAFGRFRSEDAGQPVDSTGALTLMEGQSLTDITIPLTGVADLANHLSQSEAARACLANNLAYYAYGVANENKWPFEEKVCNDHAVRQVARDSGNTLRSVLLGVLRAPHFTRRVQDQ